MTLHLDLEEELVLDISAVVAAGCPVAKSVCPETVLLAQIDQKVSVHLMIAIQSSGAQTF